jgi:hypothetical protein
MTGGLVAAALSLVLFVGCSDDSDPVGPSSEFSAKTTDAPAPAPLVTVDVGGDALTLWPFTSSNLGTPEDPVNLIFSGKAEPRQLRSALMGLDGDRTLLGFPDEFPFNCTWTDALGGTMQGAYAEPSGWVGSAVQLECGAYDPLRFHVRLFDVGGLTVANAHFELLIPGTHEHQVIHWELAEQLVVIDFLRSGLLDPSGPFAFTPAINPAPWRDIPAQIYNGLPDDLKALIGPPSSPTAVPIPSDGVATILFVTGQSGPRPEVTTQEYTIQFDQVIPKPFCSGDGFEYLYVTGPIRLTQRTIVTRSGNYLSLFHAHGRLDLTPVDPSTSPPTALAPTYTAVINQNDRAHVNDHVSSVASVMLQIEVPPSGPFRGRLKVVLKVGPGSSTVYDLEVQCVP